MERGHRSQTPFLEHAHRSAAPGNESHDLENSTISSARELEHTEAPQKSAFSIVCGRFENVANTALHVFNEQARVVRFLFCDEALRTVVIVIWVVTFGGNMQGPVVSFFYLELGMSAQQIGTAKSISQAMVLLTGPMHGVIMDKYGAYAALNLTISLCGFGCLVQACATSVTAIYIAACILGIGSFSLETVALATISRSLPPSQRCLAVSSFLLQIRVISLGTRLLYPLWVVLVESSFGVKDVVLRYRLSMMLCTAPCLLGFAWLLTKFRVFRALERPEGRLRRMSSTESLLSDSRACDAEEPDAADADAGAPACTTLSFPEATSVDGHGGEHSAATRRPSRDHEGGAASEEEEEAGSHSTEPRPRVREWCILSLCIIINSLSTSTVLLLWPLFIKLHFQWADSEYALLLLLSGLVATTALAVCPSLQLYVGPRSSNATASLIAAAAAALAFLLQDDSTWVRAGHVSLVLVLGAANTFLDPSLRAAASMCWPDTGIGRSFGTMQSLTSLGNILAYLGASYLYQQSIDGAIDVGEGGALPMMGVGVLLAASSVLLLWTTR